MLRNISDRWPRATLTYAHQLLQLKPNKQLNVALRFSGRSRWAVPGAPRLYPQDLNGWNR